MKLIPVAKPTCEGCYYEHEHKSPCDDPKHLACGSKGSEQFYIYVEGDEPCEKR